MYAIWIILKQQRVTDLQKDFINNMTHEFKTPISSIKIASDVIIQDDQISKNPRIKKYASIIKDQNERLNNQVEKVLNIARLEKDQFKLKLEQVELVSFIRHIIKLEKIKIEEANGVIEFNSSINEAHIEADKLHLSNVISNIFDNAQKYCEDKPQIFVSLAQNKNVFNLEIKDSGIGIQKDQLKTIFDKFYRVSTGNVHNVKGFGLGLFYVKNICEAHGWKIQVDSEPNKWTNFTIEIPS